VLLQEELRQANERLEQRVTQRTAELMAANRRLEAQWARARSTTAFQNEVLGIVAHDLKNPLAVIMGRTEILEEVVRQAPDLADSARNQIERIRESARRLTGMVDALIKDAMVDAMELPIRREDTDLVALVREAMEANRPLAERKGQTIAFTGPPTLTVPCDHERMREAVDNLISNAVKYSRPGGDIDVSVRTQANEVLMVVRDSGPGLLPEDFPRLFGRFQRLSARPTGGENSTGLGLFIAKRIVDLHGGRLDVVSPAPGGGSQFTIAIDMPAGREAAA
jgi:signal transduction histidine kinase